MLSSYGTPRITDKLITCNDTVNNGVSVLSQKRSRVNGCQAEVAADAAAKVTVTFVQQLDSNW